MKVYILTTWFEYEGDDYYYATTDKKIVDWWCNADSFSYRDFKTSVGKFVRKNHVQTVKHWMFGQAMEKNELEN